MAVRITTEGKPHVLSKVRSAGTTQTQFAYRRRLLCVTSFKGTRALRWRLWRRKEPVQRLVCARAQSAQTKFRVGFLAPTNGAQRRRAQARATATCKRGAKRAIQRTVDSALIERRRLGLRSVGQLCGAAKRIAPLCAHHLGQSVVRARSRWCLCCAKKCPQKKANAKEKQIKVVKF